MTRKFALSLLLIVLGLASVDAVLDHEDWNQGIAADDSAAVFSMQDGTGAPPRP